MNMKKIAAILLAVLAFQTPTFACSTFALSKGRELVVGNNDDWFCNVAFFVVNPRGVTKRTFLPSADKRLEWTSKYGSVTLDFNFVGSPSGGMNEAGLVIDESWPGPCRYPDPDARPAMDEIQWLQYQFDNCATVEEVLATDSRLRISGFFGKSHYFVCDASGKAATVEWIDGKRVTHILTQEDAPVLANDNYAWSAAELKKYQGFGGNKLIGDSTSSLDRFCRAARMVKQFATNDSSTAVDYGFEILANISQQSTAFSWIYDIANRTICYRAAQSREMKRVPLSKFDFSKGPMLMAEVLTTKSGDITSNFEPYTLEKNRDFVTRVIKSWRENHFAMHITDAEVEQMIQYPETQGMTSPAMKDCSMTNALPRFPTLNGSYLGQPPPGLKAEPFAPAVLSVPGKNHHTLSFSTDGKELYFSRYPEHVTMMMREVDGIWQPPEPAPFPGWEAVFAPDGKSLVVGNGDLFRVDRIPGGWGQAEALKGAVNTKDYEYYASSSTDGTLYFTRRVNERAMILRARPDNGAYPVAEELDAVVNGTVAFHPFVAPDGSYLLFNSFDRPDGLGEQDIYVSFRQIDGTFGKPVNLGPGVNSPERELCPVVSPDGKYLFFTRLRGETGTPYWVSAQVIEEARGKASANHDSPRRNPE